MCVSPFFSPVARATLSVGVDDQYVPAFSRPHTGEICRQCCFPCAPFFPQDRDDHRRVLTNTMIDR